MSKIIVFSPTYKFYSIDMLSLGFLTKTEEIQMLALMTTMS